MLCELNSINIEMTNSCNLKCKMCYRNHMSDSIGVMSDELFKKVVDDLECIEELQTIYFHWRGEPTLISSLEKRIAYIKTRLNSEIVMFTNGTLLNERYIEDIMSAGIDVINFSVDANSKESYQRIRGEDYFEKVRHNIILANNIRRENDFKTRIYIYGVVLEENMFELLKMKNDFEQLVDDIYLKYDMRNESSTQGITNESCKWPFTNMLIGWDGEVAPCCMDVNHDYKVGNVRDGSVKDFFYGKKMNGLRQQILSGECNELCAKCSFFA